MHCPACGSELSDKDKFCFSCGTSVQSVPPSQKDTPHRCPRCGEILEEGDKFCGYCGTETETPKKAEEKRSEIKPAPRLKYPHLLATMLGYTYLLFCFIALLLGNIAVHSEDYELLNVGLVVVALTTLGLLVGIGILAGYLLSRKHPHAKRHAKILIFLSLFFIIVSAVSVFSVA